MFFTSHQREKSNNHSGRHSGKISRISADALHTIQRKHLQITIVLDDILEITLETRLMLV